MTNLKIRKLLIDQEVINSDFTKEILNKLQHLPVSIVSTDALNLDEVSIAEGKSTLLITKYKGQFCKPCPGTSQDYICCNYQVINEMTGCPIDCAYCILQSYMTSRVLTVYTNYQKIFEEIDDLLDKHPCKIFRIGTGELADSLALEEITGITERLATFFENKKNVLFEVKTKTNHIKFLEDLKVRTSNLVLAWSINTPQVIDNIEVKSDSLNIRLAAAKKAQEMGYKLAFHLDPIVHHDNWQENYQALIDDLFKKIDPNNIVWISMGGLRFPPDLKDTIRERFPKQTIIRDEQVLGIDQKLRYFKPLRVDMFKKIFTSIRSYSEDLFIYFCMESKDVWQKTMGFAPISTNHLDYLFALSLYDRFPEMNFTEPIQQDYLDYQSKHDHDYQSKM